ncbi:DUF4019 domain-containing protein [Alteromonas sp. AMM-1]|uniref:DUF4019 domain-containing protein n=1 Tax=Alteromonas sp. AMM-1 TaxID=3394233 RepID=UPI0039A56D75
MRALAKLLLIVCCVCGAFSTQVYAQAKPQQMDIEPAYAWLELIDRGRYFQSWQYASDHFKQNIDASQWNDVLVGAKASLGDLVSRELSGYGVRDTVAGLPKGNYMVFQFKSEFTHKTLNELLIMTRENNELKTVAYLIQ